VALVNDRLSFEEAISDSLLLKKRWEEMSRPQQVILKAFYGLPLTEEDLFHWAVLQGNATHDELGYVTSVTPMAYVPKEYEQLWAILGRRSGKTDLISATIFAYESCLGGHQNYVRKNQTCVCFLIAHRLDVAQANMPFVRAALDSSPLLSKQIVSDTASGILLKNGLSIAPAPASLKASRGLAVPVVDMDEVGFWYSDSESANPDFEVERALAYAQAQFPYRKRFGTSTPYVKEGLLWKYHQAGTEGIRLDPTADKTEYQDILVCEAPTAAMGNPRISRKFLQKELARDPEAFKRESLAQFVDSISGFFSDALIRKAVVKGLAERPPMPRDGHPDDPIPFYVAAMDPAFRYDSFAFTIVHFDPTQGLVQDVVQRWSPAPGQHLNPALVLDEIQRLIKPYRITTVYSDQYQLESLQQLAIDRGFSIEGVDFTSKSKAKIFGSLQKLVNQQRLRLLDPDLSPPMAVMLEELLRLEKHISGQGTVQIGAPAGKHDDMAAVLALACFKAIWLMPTYVSQPDAEPTPFQRCMATIKKQRAEREEGLGDEWD